MRQNPILLVDDDGSIGGSYDDVGAVYMAALDAAGYTGQYDYFEVAYNANGPDAATMADYDLVIWFCGETWYYFYCATLTATDETNLATYLDGGGKLLLIAQDYLYDMYPYAGSFSPGQFPYDYLHVTYVDQDWWLVPTYDPNAHMLGSAGSPVAGSDFALASPFGTTDLFVDNLTFDDAAMFDIDQEPDGTPDGTCANFYDATDGKVVFSTLSIAGLVDGTSPNTKADLMFAIVDFLIGDVGAEEDNARIPSTLDLQAGLNPMSRTIDIEYALQASGHVSLKVYNLLGQQVTTLVDQVQPAGPHALEWKASSENTGVYFFRLESARCVDTAKLVLVR
jgi:hypothetical protein